MVDPIRIKTAGQSLHEEEEWVEFWPRTTCGSIEDGVAITIGRLGAPFVVAWDELQRAVDEIRERRAKETV
jgi:hypothetical protein